VQPRGVTVPAARIASEVNILNVGTARTGHCHGSNTRHEDEGVTGIGSRYLPIPSTEASQGVGTVTSSTG